MERDPVIMKIANSWLILNVGGGPGLQWLPARLAHHLRHQLIPQWCWRISGGPSSPARYRGDQ